MKINSKKLEIAMARTCLSITDFAVTAELPVQTLNRVMRGSGVRPGTAGKIARALGVDVTEILEEE